MLSFPFSFLLQDRENETRFGAAPVPGKIGMAMAGKGFNSSPHARAAPHSVFSSTQNNPGNQLYVGNVCTSMFVDYVKLSGVLNGYFRSCHIKLDGRI